MKQTHEEAIAWCKTVKEMGQTEIDILIEQEGFSGHWLVHEETTKDDLIENLGFEETKAEALIDAIKKRQIEEEQESVRIQELKVSNPELFIPVNPEGFVFSKNQKQDLGQFFEIEKHGNGNFRNITYSDKFKNILEKIKSDNETI